MTMETSFNTSAVALPTEEIYHANPYADHPELSLSQAELLWELAKLNQRVVEVRCISV